MELIRFDRKSYRLSLYDQDQHDATPGDNKCDCWPLNAAAIAPTLPNAVLVSNGLFYGYDRGPGSPPNGWGIHVGPNVIGGTVRYNVGTVRYAFGVQGEEFKVMLQPSKAELAKKFDHAAVGAQLLVANRKAMTLWPFPQSGDPPLRTPVPTQAGQAGHIPGVDFWKTSRVSIGWDAEAFYLLFVVEPDSEVNSKGYPVQADGGWTLADVQQFWLAKGVDYAINSDGGIVAQRWLRMNGATTFVPPKWIGGSLPMALKPGVQAPQGGGTLLYWVVSSKTPPPSGSR